MTCIVSNCVQLKQSSEKVSLHLFPDPRKDPKRHLSWIKAINSDKILKYDPLVVFKRFRVCRKHFTKQCFNGDCKQLLLNAVPTLHLNQRTKIKPSLYQDYKSKLLQMFKNNSINIEEVSLKIINLDDIQLISEPMESEKLWNNVKKDDNTATNDETEFILMEVQNGEDQAQYTIVVPDNDETSKLSKVLNFNQNIGKIIEEKTESTPFNKDKLKHFQKGFNSDPKNLLAQNICSKMTVFEAATLAENGQIWSHEIDVNVTEKTENIHWSYTLLAILKVPYMKKYDITDFEFSQAHFLYHEKLERSYSYLSNLAKILMSNDKSKRLLSYFLDDPLKEGGRWSIFTSIINKYGLMPKEAFKGHISREKVNNLTRILNTKLREYANKLMNAASKNMNMNNIIDFKMCEISNIISICIGVPPENFSWNYHNVNPNNPIFTPIDFYEQHVKPLFNVNDLFSLIDDPRPCLKYQALCKTENFDDIIGENKMLFNNQPTSVLIDVVAKSIINGEAVLAICSLNGLNNFKLKNFNMLCDIKVNSSMEKSYRIDLRDFSEKIAMIISGISTNSNGNLYKFRFEHFKDGQKIMLSIPKESFYELVLEIVVNKKFLNNDIKSVYHTNPIVLSTYDPLTNLFV